MDILRTVSSHAELDYVHEEDTDCKSEARFSDYGWISSPLAYSLRASAQERVSFDETSWGNMQCITSQVCRHIATTVQQTVQLS